MASLPLDYDIIITEHLPQYIVGKLRHGKLWPQWLQPLLKIFGISRIRYWEPWLIFHKQDCYLLHNSTLYMSRKHYNKLIWATNTHPPLDFLK